jgi:hypothetical protein
MHPLGFVTHLSRDAVQLSLQASPGKQFSSSESELEMNENYLSLLNVLGRITVINIT